MNLQLQTSLHKCLEKIGLFSPSELEEIFLHCTFNEVKKDNYLLKQGEVCNAIFFLIKGAAYQYQNGEGMEEIIELYAEHDCIVSASSLFFLKPSEEDIKAFTDCTVLTLTIQSIHELIAKSPVYFQLGKILQPGWFRVGFFDKAMSPQEKYKHVLTNKPQLIKIFPLKFLASYLKITPETLSRVRAAV
ncbi:MAG: cyclic nucleotide-binding domain-containing protein [Sphingobacteriaceae bacterium]|nr:MAG: cyclic nucleotide-binding domain-containing protein [Sphingobacteriaceae bacterium]